jgi:hypothetical protein
MSSDTIAGGDIREDEPVDELARLDRVFLDVDQSTETSVAVNITVEAG